MTPRTHPLALLSVALSTLVATLAITGCRNSGQSDDPALNAAVQSKLQADGALAGEPIQIGVQGGIATLTGTVSSPAARALAANDATQVPGVRTVVNSLSVGSLSAQGAAPAIASQPPAEVVTAPPTPPVSTLRSKPTAAVVDRRHAPAPVERQTPPAPRTSLPSTPQVAQTVPPSPTPAPPSPPPPPAFRNINVPAGTTVPIRLNTTLDSATTQEGATFSGVVATDVLIDGLVAIPQGSTASGRVDTVQEAAHYKGNSLLVIELTGINRRGGERLPVTTETFTKAGEGRGKNTTEKVGGGAAVGAILGGIFGGGKGAAIGAAAGGGAGAGANTITRGQQVQIPSETLVRFKLISPLSLRVRTSPEIGSQSPSEAPTDDSGPRRPLVPQP